VTTNTASEPHPLDPNAPPPRSSAIMGVVLTAALTAGLLSLLFYHSLITPVPDARLIIRADSSWRGARVIVEGGNLSDPQETSIEPMGKYTVPFFLSPGDYTLHVRSGDSEIYICQVRLEHNEVVEVNLMESGAAFPATAPATLPGAGA
jgi:hypothetical protein